MIDYNFHIRAQNISWSLIHIKHLLEYANQNQNSSFVLYSALECRFIIERIEFEILEMIAIELKDPKWAILIETVNGIQKTNNKYKVLRFKYQTFTQAFSEAILEDFPLKPFDFSLATSFQSRLSQYLHIYSKDIELDFSSNFIESGINLIYEILKYLENLFPVINGSYVFGTLYFNTLKNGYDKVFVEWVNSKDDNISPVIQKLLEIKNSIA